MKTWEVAKMAWKALGVNKLRSILTTSGITIGIFSIIRRDDRHLRSAEFDRGRAKFFGIEHHAVFQVPDWYQHLGRRKISKPGVRILTTRLI